MGKKAFTIIELIVVMAIIAILVLLAVPKFMNYSKEARFTKLIHDAALIEDACQRYYLDHGDWPRASDTSYTAEQVHAFSQKVYDRTGKIIVLEPDGKYYDIDLKKLQKYVRINSDSSNFILQNPVGTVYIVDPHTRRADNEQSNDGQSDYEQKPVAVINMTPNQGLTTATIIAWDYSQSYDPNGYDIVNVEWEGKQEQYTEEGEYTVRLRVQNSKGVWSDWTSITFYVFDSSNVVQIAAGGYHTVVLLKDGTVKAWGNNNYGQLGDGTTVTSRTIPVTVVGLNNVKQIAAGNNHTVALLNDGTVKAWGRNKYGQLGNGTTTDSSIPITVEGLSNVKQIDAGGEHTVALLNDGTVKAWGYNYHGELGNGSTTDRYTPVTVIISNVKQIAAGFYHTIALLNDGTVKTWGWNYWGQLGYSTPALEPYKNVPTKVTWLGDSIVKQVDAGYWHTVFLLDDGTVKACGNNREGQLGNGTMSDTKTIAPVTVVDLSDVKQIAAGDNHTVALLNDGTVKAWGNNYYGQLGDGTKTNRAIPVTVVDLNNVKQIAAGGWHTVALLNDGTIKVWGQNNKGQLGIRSTTLVSVSTTVTGLE